MSDIPELEHALVEAARRHYRRGATGAARRARHRLARPLRFAAAPLVLAAIAVAVVAVARVAAPPRAERPTDAPATTPGFVELQRAYGVFRRPRRTSDALPGRIPLSPYYDAEGSRQVGTAGGQRAFVIPARDVRGKPDLCTLTTVASTGVNGRCAPFVSTYGDGVLVSRSRRVSDGAPLLLAVFRDGVTMATIRLRDGSRIKRAVRDNAVFALLPSRAVALSWTDGRGRGRSRILPGGAQAPATGTKTG